MGADENAPVLGIEATAGAEGGGAAATIGPHSSEANAAADAGALMAGGAGRPYCGVAEGGAGDETGAWKEPHSSCCCGAAATG